jgi:SAM-dependent methyltransferase
VTTDDTDEPNETPDTASDHDHTDPRYLDAKASVDDRAVDGRVRDRLLSALPERPTVFDAGCGTGVALGRLRGWGVDPEAYHGVDTDAGLIAVARDRHDEPGVSFAAGDAVAAAERVATAERAVTAGEPVPTPELAVAGSFLDLVPVGEAMDALAAVVAPGGLVYAPFTFDGTTGFTPSHPADDLVERLYHAEIDAQPGRNTHAGRAAVDHCRRADGTLLAVGASDWVVRPTADGDYPADERYFLATILGYVADALFVDGGDTRTGRDTDASDASASDTGVSDTGVSDTDASDADTDETDAGGANASDPASWEPTPRAVAAVDDTDHTVADLRDWLRTRRRQLAAGELVYLAHQLDVLYRTG